jgi:hypothetical protein
VSDLRDRLATAYATAMKLQQDGHTVSLRVGTLALDWMKDKATEGGAPLPSPLPSTCWGFPVYLEQHWHGEEIAVETRVLIL